MVARAFAAGVANVISLVYARAVVGKRTRFLGVGDDSLSRTRFSPVGKSTKLLGAALLAKVTKLLSDSVLVNVTKLLGGVLGVKRIRLSGVGTASRFFVACVLVVACVRIVE